MTDCHIVADRMPAVANGEVGWGPSEAAHLESCPACRLEWDLVRAAQGLGAGVAAALDTSRIAERVSRRIADSGPVVTSPGLRPATRWLIGLVAAAALVLVIRPWRPAHSPVMTLPERAAAVSVLNELDDLTPSELESVLEALPSAADALPHVESAPFGDLEPKDLERMLRSLEG
jgi:anti-sigma factor RsiW